MSVSKVLYLLFILFLLMLSSCDDDEIDQKNPSPFVDNLTAARLNLRRENKRLVNQCSAMASAGVLDVNYESKDLCRLPDFYAGSKVKYRIQAASNNQITIDMKLALDIPLSTSSIQDESGIVNQVRACTPIIKEFFNRYNIEMNLIIDSVGVPESYTYDHIIKVIDDVGRSESGTWYIKGVILEGDNNLCGIMLHEIGHLLGANDEYVDPACPDRKFISTESNPFSIMRTLNPDLEYLDFYERHIRTMIQRICPTLP